jgi:hypothetical protein
MTIQEKKRFIIEKIQESNSEDFVSRIFYDITRDETWDKTKEGKVLIEKLLEKSQKEISEGKTNTFQNVLNDVKEKYGLK